MLNAIELNELKDIADVLNERPLNYQRGTLLLKSYHPKNAIYHSLGVHHNESLLREELMERYNELRNKKYVIPTAEAEIKNQIVEIPQSKTPVKSGVSKIAARPSEPTTPQPTTENQAPISKKSEDLKRAQALREDSKILFKNRGAWHRDMCNVALNKYRLTPTEKAARAQFAKMIDDATIQISKTQNLLQFFELNGYFPAERNAAPVASITSAKELTAEELKKRLDNSLMPNISKLKVKIANLKPEIDGKTEPKALQAKKDFRKKKERIAKWEQQLAILEAEQAEFREKLKTKP